MPSVRLPIFFRSVSNDRDSAKTLLRRRVERSVQRSSESRATAEKGRNDGRYDVAEVLTAPETLGRTAWLLKGDEAAVASREGALFWCTSAFGNTSSLTGERCPSYVSPSIPS